MSNQRKRLSGFTLLELLISIVVASLVVSGLLTLTNEILQIDRRESILDQVQRDMQRAVDYIGDDLKEAVYVYPNPERFTTLLASDLKFPDSSNDTPVLAFWRIDPIEKNLPTVCVKSSGDYDEDDADFGNCKVLRLRQSAYTLVIYVQRVNDGTNANWSGQSRLIRYELPNYSDVAKLIETPGYRDPASLTDGDARFEAWIPKAGETPVGNSAVLVDFVESPTVTLNRSPLSDATQACSSFGTNADGTFEYQAVPSTATTSTNTSFFACVRKPDGTDSQRTNQDVYVFLKGNAIDGAPGVVNAFSDESALPVLETRVVVRGIIDKSLD
ncbi:MAG: prepilin-type N-terminal cleavage/methylation domain-containing protein [Cyanobacteria bacterium J06649_4]